MGSTMDVASAVALAGALVALVFLPARNQSASIDMEEELAELEPAEPVLV